MWPDSLPLLELTLDTPAENVALDEALALEADRTAGGGLLRLWELSTYAVVVGRSNSVATEVHVDACRRDGVPVLRRCSGGGAVVLGPGCLVFSLVLPLTAAWQRMGFERSAHAVLDRVRTALPEVGALEVCGTSDLAIEGRKVSGNSQRWLRHAFLHHGTLLYDFDLPRIARWLRLPARQPDYRSQRDHQQFVRNLPVDGSRLCSALATTFAARAATVDVPLRQAAELVQAKYGTDAWNFRR